MNISLNKIPRLDNQIEYSVKQEAIRLINSYFHSRIRNYLHSRIQIQIIANRVEVQFFIYSAFPAFDSNFNKHIENIQIFLQIIFRKKVWIRVNRVEYPYMNADIFSKYLVKNGITKTFIRFKKQIIIDIYLNGFKLPASIRGIKIEVNGRLETERIIPRKTRKTFSRGTFMGGPENNIVRDISSIQHKNRLGLFTIRVEIAQKIRN